MIDGILNVYKESGYTSFDVVAKLRGILKQKKIGHTGTLDPMAEGVLSVCLGKATKLVDMLTEGDKKYEAVMLLGYGTDTEDVTGTVEKCGSYDFSEEEITKAVEGFIGEYDQLPPMYSAIKVDGRKLYEYARAGQTVERTKRRVEIYSITDIKVYDVDKASIRLGESFVIPDGKSLKCVSMTVHCSKGTYIRSLCRDIGESLGSCGTLMSLTRNEAHGNKIEDALKLDEIKRLYDEGQLEKYILPIDFLLKQYESVTIKDEAEKSLLNGNKLYCSQLLEKNTDKENMVRVYHKERLYGLYIYEKQTDMYKPVKMFL